MTTPAEVPGISKRSRGVTLALAALLEPFGAHRFYLGKNGTGALMLATFGGQPRGLDAPIPSIRRS
jgi:TM2 domain-containing membrane protein YozV